MSVRYIELETRTFSHCFMNTRHLLTGIGLLMALHSSGAQTNLERALAAAEGEPEQAKDIVVAFGSEQPKLIVPLVSAAVVRLPDQAVTIVSSVLAALPDQRIAIIRAVVLAAPARAFEFASAGAAALPEFAREIIRAALDAAPEEERAALQSLLKPTFLESMRQRRVDDARPVFPRQPVQAELISPSS